MGLFNGLVGEVSNYFAPSFKRWPRVPGIAKVYLKEAALAKTYRPTNIFNNQTCPIVGGGKFGELYISVTKDRLDRLRDRISKDQRKAALQHLSTLDCIAPFTHQDAIGSGPNSELSKVRLFDHGNRTINREIIRSFQSFASDAKGIRVEEGSYRAQRVVRLSGFHPNSIKSIAKFPGVQSVSRFPLYRLVRTTSRVLGSLPVNTIPAPNDEDGPVVILVDSGTDEQNKQLQAWVIERKEYVPKSQQDNQHGSFIAGLLAQSRSLNHDDPEFPSCGVRIIDVVAIDKTGTISEFDLVTILRDVAAKYPKATLVNLSLSLEGEEVKDEEFSPLGMEIDDISDDTGLRFSLPTGNYEGLNSWPASKEDDNRILSPADSVRSLAVGSIAHRESPNTCVRANEPSPFTRRGPSAAYLVSPHLVHYGGNTDPKGGFAQSGIISVDGLGNLAEHVGVSFSTPLITALWANVAHELGAGEDRSQINLAKALLIHSALLKSLPQADTFNYLGYGKPADVTEVLHCEQSSATLIVHANLEDGQRFTRPEFPIPKCLHVDGSLQCEMFATLLYDPPLQARGTAEYCRVNVDAKLGTIRALKDKNGKEKEGFQGELYLMPDFAAHNYGREEALIRDGFKWSPIKTYYRRFSQMADIYDWQLRLEMMTRSGFTMTSSQEVFFILTIRAFDKNANVYDQFVRSMTRQGWGTVDLELKSKTRVKNR